MFLHRPTSLRSSATSVLRAVFSFSRKAARIVIWFSFNRRASRERFAATLFFFRLVQYFSSCNKNKKKEKDANLTFYISYKTWHYVSVYVRFHPHTTLVLRQTKLTVRTREIKTWLPSCPTETHPLLSFNSGTNFHGKHILLSGLLTAGSRIMLVRYIHWPSKVQLMSLRLDSSSNSCVQHFKLLLPSNYLTVLNQQNSKNSSWLASSILGNAFVQSGRYSTLPLYVKVFGQRVKNFDQALEKPAVINLLPFAHLGQKPSLLF